MGRKPRPPASLREGNEQALPNHIDLAAAEDTNRTAEHLVDVPRSTNPQFYYRRNRDLLIERVRNLPKSTSITTGSSANVTPTSNTVSNLSIVQPTPSTTRSRAIVEPTPITKKRRQREEKEQVKVMFDILSSSASDSDSRKVEQSESDELSDDGWRNRVKFRDLGGMSSVIEEMEREVIVPLHQLKLLRHLGVEPTTRILFQGPPGCGKTTLARAVANEAGLPFYEISAAALVSKVSGASQENIRKLFSMANKSAPAIVFIDEIDSITSNTESVHKEINPGIVEQLIACMYESHRLIKPVNDAAASESCNPRPGYVLVIGATSRPDAVDPALRRLFDRQIVLGVPNEKARLEILSVLTFNLKIEAGFDLAKVARCTTGFVGRDLSALAKKAGILALNRITDKKKVKNTKEQGNRAQCEDYRKHPFSNEEMENLNITMADFEEATKMVQPSYKIEGLSTIPTAKWADVGGLLLLKQEFERHIIRRLKFPEVHKHLGMNLSTTFFLYGPSGCGKTLIVEALANEAGANFIHIKGTELLNTHVDQRKLVVRTIFSHARMCSPCILFFDEVEALTAPCSNERRSIVEKVLEQILIELDDAEHRSNICVIFATNMPEVVSPAVFKPGRFDKILHVPLPSPEERGMILKSLARDKSIDANVDLMALGENDECENFSGADLTALMKEAAMAAVDRLTVCKRGRRVPMTISDADFKTALGKISSFVSLKQVQDCELFSMCY